MGGGGDDGGMAIAVLDGGPSDGQRVAVPDFADQRMPPQRILVQGHVYWRKSIPKARPDPDEPWGYFWDVDGLDAVKDRAWPVTD